MIITGKIQRAINVAAKLHSNQVRKADGLPYITHPFSVALIVSRYSDDEDVVCAALLHDVLEDVHTEVYSSTDMRRDFGDRVLRIVQGVSEDKDASITPTQEKESWKQRKLQYLAHLDSDSQESLLVCCADKIHNLHSLITVFEQKGSVVFSQFNAPIADKMWFEKAVLKKLQALLKSAIVTEYEALIKEAIKIFGQKE